ncbi:MAG TPA: VCBS repeat-containing protein [Streptosporangiaceae bacterium]
MSRVGFVVAGGVAAAVLAGCATSVPAGQISATIPRTPAAAGVVVTSQARGRQASDWDVDGDGRPDRARLVYLGGYGPNNWELIVDTTTLGQRIVRFTGDPLLPGNTAAPTIAGSVDADRDGHAEIFVKVSSGASTQFWAIFKLVGRQIRQVNIQGQPVRLAVGGSLTHQGGFRCDGDRFVTLNEGTELPGYIKWRYERDTYAWSGAELVILSKGTGQLTSPRPGDPPAAYSGVSCGNLPQYAPPYTSASG